MYHQTNINTPEMKTKMLATTCKPENHHIASYKVPRHVFAGRRLYANAGSANSQLL